MINYTERLDRAIRTAAWAHEQQSQHRKGSDIPYIVHPFAVMTIASNCTDDEDILIACLLHDVLEDVNSTIYDENKMRADFGSRVLSIVKDVTKDDTQKDWHARSRAYLAHLEHKACDESIFVSASDKVHNLLSVLMDFETYGDDIWKRFSTKSSDDQLWWYESILAVIIRRCAPAELCGRLDDLVSELKTKLSQTKP